ncbi:sugar transferase [Myxococcota bacterium]|nr:sugar transferase [Myxococcota bacterium]
MTRDNLLHATRAWLGVEARRPPPPPRRCFPSTMALPDKPIYDRFTRIYQFIGVLLGLLLLSPLMLLIAIAVKRTSSGPALYRGARVGLGERVFYIYKFRSMYVGAEQKIGQRLVRQDEDHYTPIGKFLRKYRLDELPQLFNVLKGDMNLVGPRPVRPIFLEKHRENIPGYARRFLVKPGITGQAQVRGGYYTRPRHKLFYDTLYIAHRSVGLDLKLIVLTFLRVMTRIFTTTALLAWLVMMAVVIPDDLRLYFTFNLWGLGLNVLYLIPPLIVLAYLFRKNAARERVYALKTPVDLPLLGFILYTALLIPLSRFPQISARGLLWYLCNGVVVFYVVMNSKIVTEKRHLWVKLIIGAVLTVSVASVIHAAWVWRAAGYFNRLDGVFGRPIILTTLLVVALPLTLSRVGRGLRDGRYRLIAVALALTAMLTLTRSGIMAVFITLIVYYWGDRRRVLQLIALFALLLVLSAQIKGGRMHPRQAFDDLQALSLHQARVINDITPTRRLIGVGARTLPQHMKIAQVHRYTKARAARLAQPRLDNTYMTLFIDHGPLGMLFFLSFLIGGLVYMKRAQPLIEAPEARRDLHTIFASMVGMSVLLAFSDGLYYLPIMLIFWSTMGLGVGIAAHHRKGPKATYKLISNRQKL